MSFRNIDAEILSLAFNRFSRLGREVRATEIALDAAEDACEIHPRRCTCAHVAALRTRLGDLQCDLTVARGSYIEAGEIRAGS